MAPMMVVFCGPIRSNMYPAGNAQPCELLSEFRIFLCSFRLKRDVVTYVGHDRCDGEHEIHSGIAIFAVKSSILTKLGVDPFFYQDWFEGRETFSNVALAPACACDRIALRTKYHSCGRETP
jgi:hypothetical protein